MVLPSLFEGSVIISVSFKCFSAYLSAKSSTSFDAVKVDAPSVGSVFSTIVSMRPETTCGARKKDSDNDSKNAERLGHDTMTRYHL